MGSGANSCAMRRAWWISADLLNGFDFSDDWTGVDAAAGDADSFTASAAPGIMYKDYSLSAASRYRAVLDLDADAGTWEVNHNTSSGVGGTAIGTSDNTYHFTTGATETGEIAVEASDNGATVDANTLELYQVMSY